MAVGDHSRLFTVVILIVVALCSAMYFSFSRLDVHHLGFLRQIHKPPSFFNKADSVKRGKFVTYGASITLIHKYGFYLPLTSMLWAKQGFTSVVIFSGDPKLWRKDPILNLILERLYETNARIVYVPTTEERTAVALSQVMRLYAAAVEPTLGENDFVVTSDADLWVHKTHLLQPQSRMVSTNSHCCGFFPHLGQQYRMYPMGNVGAPVSVWKQLFPELNNILKTGKGGVKGTKNSTPAKNPDQWRIGEKQPSIDPSEQKPAIISEVLKKAANKTNIAFTDWYLDQKLLSIRIGKWIAGLTEVQKKALLQEIPRTPHGQNGDRVDKDALSGNRVETVTFAPLYDAHLPDCGFHEHIWRNLGTLLIRLLDKNEMRWASDYRNQFVSALKKNGKYPKC